MTAREAQVSAEEREALEVQELQTRIQANLAHARANAALEARQAFAAEERDLMRRDLEGREAERRRVVAYNARLTWVWVADLTLKAACAALLAAIALALWGGL